MPRWKLAIERVRAVFRLPTDVVTALALLLFCSRRGGCSVSVGAAFGLLSELLGGSGVEGGTEQHWRRRRRLSPYSLRWPASSLEFWQPSTLASSLSHDLLAVLLLDLVVRHRAAFRRVAVRATLGDNNPSGWFVVVPAPCTLTAAASNAAAASFRCPEAPDVDLLTSDADRRVPEAISATSLADLNVFTDNLPYGAAEAIEDRDIESVYTSPSWSIFRHQGGFVVRARRLPLEPERSSVRRLALSNSRECHRIARHEERWDLLCMGATVQPTVCSMCYTIEISNKDVQATDMS